MVVLIEFKVANFRSIREEQTFSLVASGSDDELPDCVIERELPGMNGVRFLRGAAIYGANASGKSNVLDALAYLRQFVNRSATKLEPGEPTGVEPFKLDEHSKHRPSEFELTFVADDVRYVFGVHLTVERVIEEYLVAYPKGTPQRWYLRRYDPQAKTYDWSRPGVGFKHDRSLQEKTRENSLFLSVGPQFNHPQLTTVFNWFKRDLHFLDPSEGRMDIGFTIDQFAKPNLRKRLLDLLASADIGIADANVQEKEISLDELKANLPPGLMASLAAKGQPESIKSVEIALIHRAANAQPIALDFEDEESTGTRRFFALIGPWIDILENGHTVFIDEIDSSLHPILVRELLKLLFCRENNPKGAQVVFTTHNPLLLDGELMRRDQIWFTEKSPQGATHLYPLTDYSPRKKEALAKGYLAGRYGGIPFIPEGLKR